MDIHEAKQRFAAEHALMGNIVGVGIGRDAETAYLHVYLKEDYPLLPKSYLGFKLVPLVVGVIRPYEG